MLMCFMCESVKTSTAALDLTRDHSNLSSYQSDACSWTAPGRRQGESAKPCWSCWTRWRTLCRPGRRDRRRRLTPPMAAETVVLPLLTMMRTMIKMRTGTYNVLLLSWLATYERIAMT